VSGDHPKSRPSAILCADWAKEPGKRSVYVADVAARTVSRLDSDSWSFDGVLEKANQFAQLGPVLATFDVPIGVPQTYLAAAATMWSWKRPGTFLEFLECACSSDSFFDPTSDVAEWRIERPFFSVPPTEGGLRSYIHAAANFNVELYRTIDKQTGAKPVFVKSGIPGTVGSAAAALWQDLATHLTGKRTFAVWPFEGDLDVLLNVSPVVIGEIYPRAAYATALFDGRREGRPRLFIAKTNADLRRAAIRQLGSANWVRRERVVLQDLPNAEANEDDFDACMTAAALLRSVLEDIPLYASSLDAPDAEGGILATGSLNFDLREQTFRSDQPAAPVATAHIVSAPKSLSHASAQPGTVQDVVACLNATKTRATYGAVAEVIGGLARGVGQRLGTRRTEASWVVSSATGLPSGYGPDEIHSDLIGSPLLRTGTELRELLARWRVG
jgi:hypothetical protein